MALEEIREIAGPLHRLAGFQTALGNAPVPGRIKGHHFLHGDLRALLHVQDEFLSDVPRLFQPFGIKGQEPAIFMEPGSGSLGEA